MSDPENVFDLAGSYPVNMHVTGILAPTGTADDGAIFTDYKTCWIIVGIMHGHGDVASDESKLAHRQQCQQCGGQRRGGAVPGGHGREHHSVPHARRSSPLSLSRAIIVVPHDTKSATILRGRYEDPKATVQLLVPKQVISETLDLVFRVKRFFDAQSLLVGVATALLLALVVLLSLRLRRGEMETMFKIGCARWMMFGMQAAEVVIVVVGGHRDCRACCLACDCETRHFKWP